MADTPDIFKTAPEKAKASADALVKDADLAAAVGDTPEQRAARERVAKLFFEVHCPALPAERVGDRLRGIDWARAVQVVDPATVPADPPVKKGWFSSKKETPATFIPREPTPSPAAPTVTTTPAGQHVPPPPNLALKVFPTQGTT